MTPFFSIVIPTYNRASLINKAIDSIISQTFFDWELIIIDDGSTDNTKEIINSYSDPRIKYLYQHNAERSAARNNGIQKSEGEYVCFLDSDDYYLPNRLELLYHQIKKRNFPIAAFYTGFISDEQSAHIHKEIRTDLQSVYDQIALYTIGSPQTCIHHIVLQEFQYDKNFRIGEDTELWLRIADKFSFEYLENQFTFVALTHDDRSINIKRYDSFADQLLMLKFIFNNNHPGHKISKSIKRLLISNCYFGMAKYFIYQHNRFSAIQKLLQAIIADHTNHQNKYRLNILLHLLISLKNAEELLWS